MSVPVPDRPADRVVTGDWVIDFDSGVDHVEYRPVGGNFLRGFTYEQFRWTDYGEKRRIVEYWETKETYRMEARVRSADGVLTSVMDPTVHEGEFELIRVVVPAESIARSNWEYRRGR